MLKEFRIATLMLIVMTALTGFVYPLAMTGVAQVIFPKQANGSLIPGQNGTQYRKNKPPFRVLAAGSLA